MYVTISEPFPEQPVSLPVSRHRNPVPETRLASGAHLFYEGDRVVWIYQVVSGVVSLKRLLEDGRRQIISFGFPGDIVGFPSDGRHHTDCQALSPVRLQPYRLSRIESGDTDPELHTTFLNAALREIAEMQDHFMMLGRKSATEKVASFLMALANRTGIPSGQFTRVELPMSRADIADFLGLTTETVSRTFSQLCKRHLIARDGAHAMMVLCPTSLRALSEGDGDT